MYQDGISSLFSPRDGYYQTISRITAGLATLVPLEVAPLVMNIVFILVKSYLVALLFTERLSHLCNSQHLKIIAALFILVTPNAQEVHGNVTNAHWFLSAIALLILLSEEPRSKIIKCFDYFVLLIAGLSGPFSIIISPLAIIWNYINRASLSTHSKLLTVCICVTACIQLFTVLSTGDHRLNSELGASVSLFVQIISSRLFGPVFFGSEITFQLWEHTNLAILFFVLGTATLIVGLYKATAPIRIIILYGILMLIAAMIGPMMTSTGGASQWRFFELGGGRYFAIPMVSVFIAFLVLVSHYWHKSILTKIGLSLLLIHIAISILKNDFLLRPLEDCRWKEHVAKYKNDNSFSVIPINPGCRQNTWRVDLSLDVANMAHTKIPINLLLENSMETD